MAAASSSSATSAALADAFSSSAGRALDALYSRLTRLNGKFFADGWGDLDLVRIDAAREAAAAVSRRVAGATAAAAARGEAAADGFRPDWRTVERQRGRYVVYEAQFESPAADASLPALRGPLLPRESRFARARLILPDGGGAAAAAAGGPLLFGGGGGGGDLAGLVVHLPATGDHDWSRRTRLAIPLATGITSTAASAASPASPGPPPPPLGALLLEGPFYGARRPANQRGAKVRSVADLFVLGWATIAEALLLAGWARGESARQGVCGLSMGGVHAAMSAALSPHPLAAAPLLAPRSAVFPYIDGALARSVAVEALVGADMGFGGAFAASSPLVSLSSADAAATAADAAATAADAAATAAEAAALPSAGPRCLRRVAEAVRAASQGVGEEEEEQEQEQEEGRPPPLGLRMPRAARALAALDALEAELHRAEAEAQEARTRGEGGGGSSTTGGSPPPSAPAAAAAATAAVASAARALRASAAARLSLFRRRDAREGERDARRRHRDQDASSSATARAGSDDPRRTLAWGALRAALEAYTDTTRYPVPNRPDAAVLVAAVDDAYAPPHDLAALHRHWPGSELRTVPGGHVSAFLTQQGAFRQAVVDSVGRL